MALRRLLDAGLVVLALGSASVWAGSPQDTPGAGVDEGTYKDEKGRTVLYFKPTGMSEVTPSSGTEVFVGHFGETIRYDDGWTAEARMNGQVEEVYFHPIRLGPSGQPYHPEPSDYTPQNIDRMKLMHLMVMPKDAPGAPGSLLELRQARSTDISRLGLGNKILNESFNNAPDAFIVRVFEPYCLFQLYTQTPSLFLVLSAGCRDTAAAAFRTVDSVKEYTNRFYPERTASVNPWAPFKYFNSVKKPYWWLVLSVHGVCLAVALLAWRGAAPQRLGIVGIGFLAIPDSLAVFGFLVAYIPHYLFGFEYWRTESAVIIFPLVLMPWASRWLSESMGSINGRRAFWWTAVVSLLLVALAIEDALRGEPISYFFRHTLPRNCVFGLYQVGLLLGVIFALCFAPASSKQEGR